LCPSVNPWQSMSAVSWPVHKNHEPENDPPLVPFPLPAVLFAFPIPMSILLVSLALIVAPHITRAQIPTSATSSAFTPLASKTFDWNNLVRFSLSLSVQAPNLFSDSHIKPTPTMAFAAANTVTIAVIQRPRTNSRSARPLFSTRLTVSGEACPLCSPPEAAARAKTPHVSWGLNSRKS